MYTNPGKGVCFGQKNPKDQKKGASLAHIYMSQKEHVWSRRDPGEGRWPVKAGRVWGCGGGGRDGIVIAEWAFVVICNTHYKGNSLGH